MTRRRGQRWTSVERTGGFTTNETIIRFLKPPGQYTAPDETSGRQLLLGEGATTRRSRSVKARLERDRSKQTPARKCVHDPSGPDLKLGLERKESRQSHARSRYNRRAIG